MNILLTVKANTPLDKNIRPPSKMKKKIVFTIFRL